MSEKGRPTKAEIFRTMLGKEALKTDAMNSLLHEILLTQFLHAMMWSADSFGAQGRDMDSGWKKEVTAIQEVLKGVATSAELFSLTEQVGLIEEHLCQVRQVLKLTEDDDDEQ
ncbi:hypothetical protein CJ030_MR7G001556 [Morella rubra]|uniref:Uncharacterized protein n=1 Tax=Morella rubra TaxID=262757 RepID=A0A6A1V609_9ROSI|nr:hypothetical protein CJ030_MR7G001556 [Morella rubra]